jgi:hypothetical protein
MEMVKAIIKNLFVSLLVMVFLLGSSCTTLTKPDGSTVVVPANLGKDFQLATSFEDFVTKVRSFAVSDLTNALKIAEADDDVVAGACWAYALKYNQAIAGEERPATEQEKTSVGLATVIQSVRHVKTKVGTGIPQDLKLACGALYNDVRLDVLKIGAAAAASGALKIPVMPIN